ncbi:GTP pyrophosphokinase family protein [Cellulosilyticum sp. ST5]|uniref:RelA/SpoT domain protein n=1 Tax=Cellulosilyticum lentocellum (strain ATCC 49066 / DSM 5427 / NCIMB 11756 / RHM5) TaxID=642492 RepID=F2JLQ4_CELLD|nr:MULTISPECIES: GTP pyrophosphokinase family protein [Cellulosilyticum]ADZ84580.1 RelA/SpoT domain protein [Cellulosilyticum lentocellum DSM 5427]QEH70059.1 GTP pyrophosphokinase family protein [Cellulosilyticum sp. WCF-2]
MEMQNWKRVLLPYNQAVDELKVKFKSIRKEFIALDEYSPIEFVTGRVKKISSILEKAQKKNIPLEEIEEKIEDIAGIRIMCQFVEDIYKVIDIIKARDRKDLVVVEERDYITNTKSSGYRSYHMIIKYPVQTGHGEKWIFAEIQIRTLAMNFWATIEHSLRYKYKQNMPKNIQERLNKAAEAAFLLDQEMAEIREEVLKCQESFQEESNLIGDIFSTIQAMGAKKNKKDMNEIYEIFWTLWEEGDMCKLKEFNESLAHTN